MLRKLVSDAVMPRPLLGAHRCECMTNVSPLNRTQSLGRRASSPLRMTRRATMWNSFEPCAGCCTSMLAPKSFGPASPAAQQRLQAIRTRTSHLCVLGIEHLELVHAGYKRKLPAKLWAVVAVANCRTDLRRHSWPCQRLAAGSSGTAPHAPLTRGQTCASRSARQQQVVLKGRSHQSSCIVCCREASLQRANWQSECSCDKATIGWSRQHHLTMAATCMKVPRGSLIAVPLPSGRPVSNPACRQAAVHSAMRDRTSASCGRGDGGRALSAALRHSQPACTHESPAGVVTCTWTWDSGRKHEARSKK